MVLVALLASPLATPGSVALAQDATPTSASAPAVDAESVLPVDEMPEPTVAPDVPPTEAPIAPTIEATVEPTLAPTVETTPEPTPTATVIPTEIPVVQNTDTFSLTTPLETPGVATLGEDGQLVLTWDYAVTTDRAGTEIVAEILDENGAPATGWSVTFPATGTDSLMNSSHITAGAVLPIEVLVTGPSGEQNQSIRLVLTSTVIFETAVDSPITPQVGPQATILVGNHMPTVVATTPVLQQEAESATPVAGAIGPLADFEDGDLTCTTHGESPHPIAPGEVIAIDCEYQSGALLGSMYAKVTLDSNAYSDDWQISVLSTSLQLTLLDLTGWQTGWDSQTQEFSSVGVLPLASDARFTVYLKAPLSPQIDTAQVNVIAARCQSEILCKRSVATIPAALQQTEASSGGGTLLNGLLLPNLSVGKALFGLVCENANGGDPIPQGQPVVVTCSIELLTDISVLDRVLSLGATVSLTSSLDSGIVGFKGVDSNLLDLDVGDIASAEVGKLSEFYLIIHPSCAATPQNLHSLHLSIDYSLTLAGVEVNLTDGWATVPFSITDAAPAAPYVSVHADEIAFGTYEWEAGEYVPVDGAGSATLSVEISQPATGCLASLSDVSISASPMQPTEPEAMSPIPGEHLSITSVTAGTGALPWGSIPENSTGTLGQPRTIFETSSVDTTTAEPVELELNLSLSPPPNAPPGDYEGTITITSYPSGAPGE